MPSTRNIIVFFSYCLDEIDFIGFQVGSFSTGFTLSADRQEIVGYFVVFRRVISEFLFILVSATSLQQSCFIVIVVIAVAVIIQLIIKNSHII